MTYFIIGGVLLFLFLIIVVFAKVLDKIHKHCYYIT